MGGGRGEREEGGGEKGRGERREGEGRKGRKRRERLEGGEEEHTTTSPRSSLIPASEAGLSPVKADTLQSAGRP